MVPVRAPPVEKPLPCAETYVGEGQFHRSVTDPPGNIATGLVAGGTGARHCVVELLQLHKLSEGVAALQLALVWWSGSYVPAAVMPQEFGADVQEAEEQAGPMTPAPTCETHWIGA